jgi:L-ascorbate metabolism protein UlaG (beta-lactamase superfamily)
MRLTKYGHSCLLVEEGRARLLLDRVPSPAGSRSWRA